MSTETASTHLIDPYLREALERNGSDLHFLAMDPPRVRVYGNLKELRDERLDPAHVQEALYQIMSGVAQKHFEAEDAVDFAYEVPGLARFRVNAFEKVSRVLKGLSDDVRDLVESGTDLTELDGIGESSAQKIRQYIEEGRIDEHQDEQQRRARRKPGGA